VKKVLAHEDLHKEGTDLKSKLQAFVQATATVAGGDTLPPIVDLYRATFNSVDTFDTYLGHIPWLPMVADLDFRVLIGYIQMALINCYSYWVELNWDKDVTVRQLSISSFLFMLYHDVIESCGGPSV
jgi:hypothetical protein